MKRETCQRCTRPMPACFCESLPLRPIANCWPVHILQHRQERNHALNTARIAALGLVNCHTHSVTDVAVEETLPAAVLADLADGWLIYPGNDSRDVSCLDAASPRPLILLDASWRKSRRMLMSSAWLQALPRISFAVQKPSRYRLRKEPQANCTSSLEALCTILGVLEQDQEKYTPLLASMDLMVELQITRMGYGTYERNYPAEN